MPVSLPTFIPFFGAFVTVRTRVSRRGEAHSSRSPDRSSAGSARPPVWAVGSAQDTTLARGARVHRLPPQRRSTCSRSASSTAAASSAPSPSRGGGRIRYEGGVPVEALAPDREPRAPIAVLYVLSRRRSSPACSRRGTAGRLMRRTASSSRRTTRSSISRAQFEAIGEEFFTGFEAVERIDRPGRLLLRLGTLAEGSRRTSSRARRRGSSPRRAGRSSPAAARA